MASKKSMHNWLNELKNRAYMIIGLAVIMWLIEIANAILGHQLCAMGIYPRTMSGLPGIVLAPFLHHGMAHVLANTVPLVALGALVLLKGRQTFIQVSVFIMLTSGVAVWILGRSAYHVGASGLVMGYFGYLIARWWYDRSVTAIAGAVLAIALYGGLLLNVVPSTTGMSWEMHLFGFLSGVLAAWVLNRTSKQEKSIE